MCPVVKRARKIVAEGGTGLSTLHGSLRVGLKIHDRMRERARLFTSRSWIRVALLSLIISAMCFLMEPNLKTKLGSQPWALTFPMLAFLAMVGSLQVSSRLRDRKASLARWDGLLCA
jgi:cytochrome bd-type quinol oxidase subunit 2